MEKVYNLVILTVTLQCEIKQGVLENTFLTLKTKIN